VPLRRAATGLFALVAVLPLLLFGYALYAVGALGRPIAQVTLALALGLVCVGFYIFQLLIQRMTEIMRAAAASAEAAGAPGPAPAPRSFSLPGFGTIDEPAAIRDVMTQAAAEQLRAMWQPEAEPLVGRRVLVSVRNAAEPIAGTLVQVTADGLLLTDDGGRRVGVSYRRISAVEAAPPP
jgi:hypothetical protein